MARVPVPKPEAQERDVRDPDHRLSRRGEGGAAAAAGYLLRGATGRTEGRARGTDER